MKKNKEIGSPLGSVLNKISKLLSDKQKLIDNIHCFFPYYLSLSSFSLSVYIYIRRSQYSIFHMTVIVAIRIHDTDIS